MYTPIVKSFRERLSSLSEDERNIIIDREIKIIKSLDNFTFDFNTHLEHPLRFWREEHEFVIREFRPNF